VLAAGFSSRLGQPKQLLELDGKPLLQHVVDAVTSARPSETIVVLGHEAGAIADAIALPSGARAIVNPDHARGQSTSLLAGLAAVESTSVDAAVIVLGDQPRLTPDLVERAVDAFAGSDAAVVRSVYGGVPGHPVVIARSRWAELRALTGDSGARDVLDALGPVLDIEMGSPLADVDTWEDYERIRRPPSSA
jgi:molybdenum cofactor cytidylyltransferase